MTYRIPVKRRPWLRGVTYDNCTRHGHVHYDVYAYTDPDGAYWFEVLASHRGREALAYSLFSYDPTWGAWRERVLFERPAKLAKATWRRRNRRVFRVAHPRLLALCTVPPMYLRAWPLFHYVATPDADPWPRGTVNMWRPYTYAPGKRPGRPKRVRAGVLPDVL